MEGTQILRHGCRRKNGDTPCVCVHEKDILFLQPRLFTSRPKTRQTFADLKVKLPVGLRCLDLDLKLEPGPRFRAGGRERIA